MTRAVLFLIVILTLACSPNQSILRDKSAALPESTPTPVPTPIEPAKKFTVSELMDRVVKAPPDSFLFPCTLNAYSNETRANLAKIREQWLAKEQDARYMIAPSTGCVCPGICILAVEDSQTAPPSNAALIVLDQNSNEKYYWLARGLDLSGASLSWLSSTPEITFNDANGTRIKYCTIDPPKTTGHSIVNCTDASGRKISLSQ
jgi:hypothetical protein